MSWLFAILLFLGVAYAQEGPGLECLATDPCEEVLPGAVRFERVPGKPYAEGFDASGARVGWIVLSNHVTDIKGYSGKPLSTLVGVDPEGVVTGGRVVSHSEPILLVGIPESDLHDFVREHVGVHVDDKVVVGRGTAQSDRVVDVVSGATVTVLAQNRTIMESARLLAQDVGVIQATRHLKGSWIPDDRAWTWKELERRKVFGRLTVGEEVIGASGEVDLFFTIADAPQVGRALLGDRTYAVAMEKLGEGEHLIVILNRGEGSFKGSGFVRGGIFDRIRLDQGLTTVMFTDLDYWNLPAIQAEGSPAFREGGLFIARSPSIDPGRPFSLVFLGNRFTLKKGFARDFQSFEATHQMPRSVYRVEELTGEQLMWRSAWAGRTPVVVAVVLYFVGILALFAARRWTSGSMARLQRIHTSVLIASFVFLGLWLHVQPSVTQLLTLAGSIVGEWRWSLFLSDPLVFVSWIFIAVGLVLWGRGVFCGWACPYGAMSELLFKLGKLFKVPSYELPDAVHYRARYLRYGVFAVLLATYLASPETGEKMAEIEPFKSTFFVPFWTRHAGLAAWWLVLAGASVVWYRPFCRYLCPLGAALALPSSFRLSGPYRRDFCTKCKICYKGCEPRAIDYKTGKIDPRECLNCWECEANWRDDYVCPPLVKTRREREKEQAA